jgi:hypothetical protein
MRQKADTSKAGRLESPWATGRFLIATQKTQRRRCRERSPQRQAMKNGHWVRRRIRRHFGKLAMQLTGITAPGTTAARRKYRHENMTNSRRRSQRVHFIELRAGTGVIDVREPARARRPCGIISPIPEGPMIRVAQKSKRRDVSQIIEPVEGQGEREYLAQRRGGSVLKGELIGPRCAVYHGVDCERKC